MDPHTQRAEAERWLGIAAKLLTARDFLGSKTFAIRAREADPNNAVSDQILAVVDTVLGGEKRVNSNQIPDWYTVLQLPRLVRDPELIADHYRRLILCLNPERNRLPFADYALQLVMDAWSVLSDPTKKWLFDNELALYLQQSEPPVPQSAPPPPPPVSGGSGGGQLNTFQFFQPPPPQQQQQQAPQPMWQAAQAQQQQQQQQQVNQREFMPLAAGNEVQQVVVPPQWQMRDPTPVKGGGGERNKGVLNGIGGGVRGGSTSTATSPVVVQTQGLSRPVARAQPVLQHQQQQDGGRVAADAGTTIGGGVVVDGNVATSSTTTTNNVNVNVNVNDSVINDAAVSAANVANVASAGNVDNAGNIANVASVANVASAGNVDNGVDVNENKEEEEEEEDVVVEEVESFWTACPYCFYIYEYQKVYQECTLRCQNCRKGFHAVQIPNPPPINGGGGGGKEKDVEEKEKEKEKGKENSFCCWGFFPLGFSMTAWKKQNQSGNLNGSSSWVPFSPMFSSPVANGGGDFKWFDNNGGNAFVGPKNVPKKSDPRVYIDDDAFIELSDPSDPDSSDGDWRTYNQEKNKKKKKRRGNSMGNKRGRKGRPRRADGLNQVKQHVTRGGGGSVGGEHLVDSSDAQQVVVGLAAGDKSDTSKTVSATHTRKQTRRSVKDVGRLDLNVEFNNEGEDHAPTKSAVNGEEDGIENIAFFEGLDEFLSTLPILNVGGDEKAKAEPSL